MDQSPRVQAWEGGSCSPSDKELPPGIRPPVSRRARAGTSAHVTPFPFPHLPRAWVYPLKVREVHRHAGSPGQFPAGCSRHGSGGGERGFGLPGPSSSPPSGSLSACLDTTTTTTTTAWAQAGLSWALPPGSQDSHLHCVPGLSWFSSLSPQSPQESLGNDCDQKSGCPAEPVLGVNPPACSPFPSPSPVSPCYWHFCFPLIF